MLVVISVIQHNSTPWQVIALILAVSIGLRVWGEDGGGQFAMMVIYVVTGIAAMEVWHADSTLFYGVLIKQIGDVIIVVVVILSILKLIFSRGGEFFLATADFLVLSVCTFLAVASQNQAFGVNLNGPLFRFVLLMFAVRTVLNRSGQTQKTLHAAVMVFLGFVLVVDALSVSG